MAITGKLRRSPRTMSKIGSSFRLSSWIFRPDGTSPVKGDLARITVVCPKCERTVEYGRLQVSRHTHQHSQGWTKLACRVCYQKFDVPALRYHGIWPRLVAAKPGEVGLWGDTATARALLSCVPLYREKVSFLFDDEPARRAEVFEGFAVQSPGRDIDLPAYLRLLVVMPEVPDVEDLVRSATSGMLGADWIEVIALSKEPKSSVKHSGPDKLPMRP